jgi:hypothetical protein
MEEPDSMLPQLHDSILDCLLHKLDTRTKCALMTTSRNMMQHCDQPQFWTAVSFDSAAEQRSLEALQLMRILERAQGQLQLLHLAR